MPDSTDVRSIREEMDAIQAALIPGFQVIPTRTAADVIAERERVAALQRRFQDLQARLPRTGAQAGVLEINGRLGTDFSPPSRIEDREPEVEADPFLRYMRELGQDWT